MILYVIRNKEDLEIKGIDFKIDKKVSLNSFLNKLCLSYGSSLQGRLDCFKHHTKYYQKLPIIVSLSTRYILVPLMALGNNHCILLNYYMMLKIKALNNYQTQINFLNGEVLVVDCDARVIKKQMRRIDEFIASYGAYNIYNNV